MLTKGQTQFVFIDTPGLLKAKNKLAGKDGKEPLKDSVADVDAAVFGGGANWRGQQGGTGFDRKGFRSRKLPAILAVNKIDLVEPKERFKTNGLRNLHIFTIFPLSCRFLPCKRMGLIFCSRKWNNFLWKASISFQMMLPTDQPERVLAGEMLREKILLNMRDEIPHGTAVSIERFQERGDILHIDATIFCERDSHKGMIIGKGGNMLKKIASEARRELEDFFQIQVNLQCWVKVKENWRNREGVMRSLGFE